jgi:hypothetical protein
MEGKVARMNHEPNPTAKTNHKQTTTPFNFARLKIEDHQGTGGNNDAAPKKKKKERERERRENARTRGVKISGRRDTREAQTGRRRRRERSAADYDDEETTKRTTRR